MNSKRCTSLLAVLVTVAGCGPEDGAEGGETRQQFVLQASGGTYDDGSGRPGTAMLVTLRDAAGAGPSREWTGELLGDSGSRASFTYSDASSGSYVTAWWPLLPYTDGRYHLSLGAQGDSALVDFPLSGAGLLVPPAIHVSADGAVLTWEPVPGAAAYECRITAASGAVRAARMHETSCPVGDLPDDGYSASVLAYSADVTAVAADIGQQPALPARFDVTEGRVSFLREDATPVAVISAAGGALDYGLGFRTLAAWLSIRAPDGSPTTMPWEVAITGPDIPEQAPLRFTYPASFSQRLVWSYEQPAKAGLYEVAATSGGRLVRARFSVGEPAALSIAADVSAQASAQGGADVTWTPVPGARSYLVGVWQGAEFVTSQWVAAPPGNFPMGTFAPEQVYDVYVAATDVDMVGSASPLQVAVTETLQPAHFVAR